jgi:hypothetical protein
MADHHSARVVTSGITLYIQLIWRTITVPVCLHVVLHCTYNWYGGPSLCPCSYIWYYIVHTTDMTDYHCARVLTSGITWYIQLIWRTITVPVCLHLVLHGTYNWYGGLSLCPCTYIWYCMVHALDDGIGSFSSRFASCNKIDTIHSLPHIQVSGHTEMGKGLLESRVIHRDINFPVSCFCCLVQSW